MQALRRHRRWLPGLAALLLVVMQLVASAHVCRPVLAAAAAAASQHATGCPGHDVDTDGGALVCKAHCTPDLQSLDRSAGSLDVQAPLLLALPLVGLAVDPGERLTAQQRSAQAPPPGAKAPLYLSLLVLRN